MLLEENRRPPFDPLTPLLPEEVCWILDRSFACEVNASARAPHRAGFHLLSFCVGTDGIAFREDAFAERLHHLIRAPPARHQP